MSGFIEWLEKLSKKDSKVRAVLRRSLSFDPGTFAPAYPYVEPFVKDEESYSGRREVLYLVAALWAMHWKEGRNGPAISIGKACANHLKASKSASTERRFITLLDSDREQLPHRLRQMVALLKEQNIDFNNLLEGLIWWNDERKHTQNAWARDFYQNVEPETEAEPNTQEEKSK